MIRAIGYPMSILYVGLNGGTSRHRFLALKRSGYSVTCVDPYQEVRSNLLAQVAFKTGFLGLERRITNYVLAAIGNQKFDVIWVDNGEAIGRSLAIELKARCDFLINHNLDNP